MSSWQAYKDFILRQNNGNALDLATASVKVGLITNAVVPNSETDTLFSAYTEVTGGGYTAGGINITSGESLDTATTGQVKWLTSIALDWLQNGGGFNNASYAVAYLTSTGRVICFVDFGGIQGNTLHDLIITGPSTSILTIAF
jgi:hypothetical protein